MSTELSLLTGEPAGEMLTAVVGEAGGTLLRWSATQVDHQPRGRTTVGYTARVRWGDGTETGETFGACSGPLPDGVVRLSDGVTDIGVWRFPFDPELPALPTAFDAVSMRRLVEGAGLRCDGEVRLRVRSYRPRRRAVIEVTTPDRRQVFVKVVRPARARDLHERHRLAASAAVPQSLGWTDDGLVLLAGLPGRTLRQALLNEESVALDAGSVVSALDGLPPELATGERRRTWGQKAGHYAEVIAAAAPEFAGAAREIARSVDHDRPQGPDVPVHGDLYENQLMVRDGRVTGLLDIDGAGRGERLDDAGCLLGHLAVLAQLRPDRAASILAVGTALEERFTADLDPAALAGRAAAVVLSLATGPHRVQEPGWREQTGRRLALARGLLDEKSFTRGAALASSSGGIVDLVSTEKE
ncbi:phosphotransferase [Amycolatopsis sp. 195334CR]|uniref:phosphotransferase n=1 Tax=Amycolatopsis sp. 195334CR TaxID=2814588 RepID=UPI001A8F4CB3|nr:phosphotransferase [Amycolatopsis sp. 195334CR]MBN6039204.1 aminoglycoside phosphotransferase family protein [Amycolatopsis sp. 195334CR]